MIFLTKKFVKLNNHSPKMCRGSDFREICKYFSKITQKFAYVHFFQ